MALGRPAALLAGLATIACSDRSAYELAPDSTSTAASTTASHGDDAANTTDRASTSGATDPAATNPSSSDDEEGPSGSDFLPPRDVGEGFECDTLTQDCPPGHKCTWWANDGGAAWNATRCVPVLDDPAQPGEPCTMEGHVPTGLDDCALGSMCFFVDRGVGTCVPFCTGSYRSPFCEDPQRVCSISGSGLALCIPRCDPLAQDCEGEGQVCYPNWDGWTCAPDASGDAGAWGDPCEYTNACDGGTVCIGAQAHPSCSGATGCCAALCDHTEATADAGCAAFDPALSCVPWYQPGLAPIGLEDVGVCMVPP